MDKIFWDDTVGIRNTLQSVATNAQVERDYCATTGNTQMETYWESRRLAYTEAAGLLTDAIGSGARRETSRSARAEGRS